MLQQVLRKYDGWPSIAEIIVVMNGLSEDHAASRLGVTKTPICFVNDSINSLNSRFAVADKVKTEADDDDLFFTPQSAAYLFRIWQRHRRSIVGSTARFCVNGTYRWRDPQCFNGVLTGAAFVPTELMREYFKPTGPTAQVRAHVDEHQNCEDINFVAAAATELNMDAPVLVKIGPVLILHSEGPLSDSEGHYRERRACGRVFMGFFGGLHLPNISHTYILLARSQY